MWHFNFFGGLRASNQERVVERFRTQKTAALLALLALRGGRSREDICALLWPDAAPEASRNSLSAALSALRRDLGEDIVRADRTSVSLAPSLYQTDVALFNDALKAGDLARAVELYRGHLLPGFHEDPFPSLEREYEEKARATFKTRLEELEENGQSTELLELARRAVTLFGDDERWFLALMRGHYGLGDLDAALRAYDSLGRFMRKNGDTASESARVLAKLIRRDKEREAIAPPTSTFPRRPTEPAQSIVPPRPFPSPPPPSLPLEEDDNWDDEAETTRNNLPTQWTRFFGREDERSLLRTWLLDGQKMVTLSGAGGSGKTRLALETLRELASDWDGDIVYVPLAPLSEPDLILPAVRDALQLAGTPDLSPLEQIERTLRGRRALLFLDNFEQLVEGGAARLQSLRERLPQTTFLVTSRVLLQLPGEREFPVAPLPTPLRNTAPAQVRECASAALFCDRSGLVLDASNAESMGALCRRLDGIPLALELAAARAKVLSPAQILERLQKHPDFLQSRELGVPARHKTLRATIEWSTDLLPPDLREFWTRLSLFHGGWTLDAAEKIAAPGICEDWETLDWLTLLRECSLIFTEESGDSSRFRMLQTLREFGREQLQHSAQVEHAFFDFYLGLAQQAASAMQGPGQTAWLARLDAEQDNLRAALTYARDAEPERGLLLATALIDFWETRLSLDEGRGWIETFLKATATGIEKPPVPAPKSAPVTPLPPPAASTPNNLTTARVRALSGAGRLASHSIELAESRTLVEQGLDAARESGDAGNIVYAISSFVRFAMTSGDVETDMLRARTLADEAVQLARGADNKALLLEALTAYNYIRISLIELDGLRVFFHEAIALARELKDEAVLSRQLSCLAHLCYHEKKWDEANALLDESTAIARRLTSTWELLEALWTRSNVARESGNLPVARVSIAEEWEICRDNPILVWARTMNMVMISYLRIREGDPVSAVRVFGSEEVARKQSGFQMAPIVRLDYNRYRDEALCILGQDRFDALWKEGRGLPEQQAVDAALYGTDSRDTSSLTAARAHALSGAGRLAFYASDLPGAENLLRQGLDEARRSGDSSVLIHATRSSALATTAFGDAARARDLGRESVRLARESGDQELLLKSLLDWGFAEVNVSDFLAAETACLEAITLARRECKDRSLAIGLSTLAIAYNYLHRYDEGRALITESRDIARREGMTLELIVSSALFGHIASIQGEHATARAAYRESIELLRASFANSWTSVNVLLSAAYSFFRHGDVRGCTLIMGASESLAQRIGYEIMPFFVRDYEQFRSQSRRVLGDAEFARIWSEGRSLSAEQIIGFILEDNGAHYPLPEPPANSDSQLAVRARALSGAGRLAWHDSDFSKSRLLVEQGLEAARKSGDTASFVHAVAAFVRWSTITGDIEGDIARGRALSEEAVALSRVQGDESLLAESLISLAFAAVMVGSYDGMREVHSEAIELARKTGDDIQLSMALVSFASMLYHQGQLAESLRLLDESTTICRRLNSPFYLFSSLWNTSNSAREQGDFAAAQAAILEALDLCRDNTAFRWNISNGLLGASYLLVRQGNSDGAVQLMGAALSLGAQVGYQLVPALRLDYERYRALALQILGEADFLRAWEQGEKLTATQSLDFAALRLTSPTPSVPALDPLQATRARALSGAGRLAWYASDMERAGSLLRQGLDAAREIGDAEGIVYATRGLMRTLAVEGQSAQASQLAHDSLELARSSGDVALLIKSLLDQGFADINSANVASALKCGTEATTLSRQIGDESSLSLALNISAIALAHSNRNEEALDLIAQSEEVARRVGSVWDVQILLANKGRVLSRLGQHAASQAAFNECFALYRESLAESWSATNTFYALGYCFIHRGDVRDGMQLIGAAEAMRGRIGYSFMPIMVPDHEEALATARQVLDEAERETLLRRGAAMTLDEVFGFAIRSFPQANPPTSPGGDAPSDEIRAARARALSGAGRLAWYASDMKQASALLEQGLNASREIGDTEGIVYATRGLTRTAAATGDSIKSRHVAREALELARSSGDSALLIKALLDHAFADINVGELDAATSLTSEAIALSRQICDETALSLALNIGAIALSYKDQDEEALTLIRQSEEVAHRIGSVWDLLVVLSLKGHSLSRLEQHAAAWEAFNECLVLCRESFSESWTVANCLIATSYSFLRRGEVRDGVQILGAAEAMRERIGHEIMPVMVSNHERFISSARQTLGETEFAAALQRGASMSPSEIFDFAIRPLPSTAQHNDSAPTDELALARSRALSGAGRLAWHGSDFEASRSLVEQGLETARQSGDLTSFVYSVASYVRFAMVTGDTNGYMAKARVLSEEAVERSRRAGDKALLLDSLTSLAYAHIIVSRFDEAHAVNQEAIALARELGDETRLVNSLNNQASVYFQQGILAPARTLLEESIPRCRGLNSTWDLIAALWTYSGVVREQGDLDLAERSITEVMEMCRANPSFRWGIYNVLLTMSYLIISRGDAQKAVQLMAAGEALCNSLGYTLVPVQRPEYERYKSRALAMLGQPTFDEAWQQGLQLSPEAAMELALRRDAGETTAPEPNSSDATLAARARALSGAGRLAWHDSDIQASRALVDEGLEAARQSGDLASFVYAVAAFVRSAMVTEESEGLIAKARLLSTEAVELSRRAGNKSLLLDSLISLGYATCILQQMQESVAANEEAIAIARELGDDANLGRALTTLAGVYYHLGNSAALVLLEECVEISRRLGSPWDIIAALWLLSGVLRQQGQLEDSYAAMTEVFEICLANPSYRWNVAHVLMMASYLFVEGGDASCAVRLMAASESLGEALGYHPTPNLLPEYERYKAKARDMLGESAFYRAWEEGRVLTPEAAIQLALDQGPLFLSKNSTSSNAAPDGALAARSRALSGAGRLASQGSDTESSRALVTQALEAARQSGDTASFVSAVSAYVRFSMLTGDSQGVIAQSRLLGAEAVDRARREKNKALLLDSLISFAYATCMLSRFKESFAASEEAVRLARELGDDTSLVRALNNQVNIYYHQGIYLPARIILEETEALSRRRNSPAEIISSLWGLSSVAREQDELDVAEAAMIEILEICRANPSFRWGISNILVSASYLFIKRDEPTDAVLLMAAASALDDSLGYRTIPVLLVDFERYKALAFELLGQVPFDIAWQEGRRLSTDAAIELALRLKTPPSKPDPEPTTSKTLSDEVLAARSRALSGAGRLAWHNNDLESSGRLVQEGLDAARESGDLASFVYAVAAYVRFAMVTGDITGLIAKSRLLSEEAVTRSRRAHDKPLLLDSLISLGYSTSIVSQFRESYTANEEAIALARELGDETSLVRVLNNQGTVYYCQGMYAPARMVLEESEQICRRLNSTWDLIAARWTFSSVAREQGNLELADESISEVLRIYRANPSIMWGGTNVLLTASYLFVRRNDAHTAVRLMSAAESILETLGYHLVPVLATDYERYRTQARQMLSEPDFASAWEEGHLLTPEAAIDLALQI